MAGIISLYNDFRLSSYRTTAGFLNPLLYSGGFGGINDIAFGANPGCNTNGFFAAPGWDPVRPSALVSFPSHFRRWLILWSIIGLRSGVTRHVRVVEQLRRLG